MRAAAAPVLAALALAGCGGAPEGAALQKQEQARAAELAKLKGWDRMFQPDAAMAAANQFGFRVIRYATAPQGYRAVGGPVMISSSPAGVTNQVSFLGSGATEQRMDAIAFDL